MACSNVPTSRSIQVDTQALGHQDAEIASPGPRSPIGKSHILGSCLSGELASPFWNVTWRWINFVSDLQNYRCSSIFSIHHPFLGIFHITHSHQPMLSSWPRLMAPGLCTIQLLQLHLPHIRNMRKEISRHRLHHVTSWHRKLLGFPERKRQKSNIEMQVNDDV